MVKKMKLKFSFAILLACILPLKVNATDKPLAAEGVFRCGSNLSTSTFAYKDEHGAWKGFDADIYPFICNVGTCSFGSPFYAGLVA